MVKHILFFCVFVWTCVFAFGEENKLYGPDGKLCVIVSDECLLTVYYMKVSLSFKNLH